MKLKSNKWCVGQSSVFARKQFQYELRNRKKNGCRQKKTVKSRFSYFVLNEVNLSM